MTSFEASLYDDMTLRRSAGVPQKIGLAISLENFENLIGRYHFVAMILLHLLAVVALASLLLSRRRSNSAAGSPTAILLLGGAVLFRSALFAWLDATAFDGTQDRFLFPVLPLWTAIFVLAIGYSVTTIRVPQERGDHG